MALRGKRRKKRTVAEITKTTFSSYKPGRKFSVRTLLRNVELNCQSAGLWPMHETIMREFRMLRQSGEINYLATGTQGRYIKL